MAGMKYLIRLIMAALALVLSQSAFAASTLNLTGGLYFQSLFGPNYFDPANGFVANGYFEGTRVETNPNGVTVAMHQRGAEGSRYYSGGFEFDDGANQDTAEILINEGIGDPFINVAINDYGRQSAYAFFVVLEADQPVFGSARFSTGVPRVTYTTSDDGKTLIVAVPAAMEAASRNVGIYLKLRSTDVFGPAEASAASLSSAAAVPEAKTWAMMIVGFAVIGGAMRQCRLTADGSAT